MNQIWNSTLKKNVAVPEEVGEAKGRKEVPNPLIAAIFLFSSLVVLGGLGILVGG